MATDWSWPLTRTLTLKSGEQLRTLHDAANLIGLRFGGQDPSRPRERPALWCKPFHLR
jgi:hypothetical protein